MERGEKILQFQVYFSLILVGHPIEIRHFLRTFIVPLSFSKRSYCSIFLNLTSFLKSRLSLFNGQMFSPLLDKRSEVIVGTLPSEARRV